MPSLCLNVAPMPAIKSIFDDWVAPFAPKPVLPPAVILLSIYKSVVPLIAPTTVSASLGVAVPIPTLPHLCIK